MMSDSTSRQWILILSLTASLVSVAVLAQVAGRYAAAYWAAPAEISTFVDAVDSSVQENDSYDRDVSKVQRLDDRLRLARLLGEIQKRGDDLRQELSALLAGEDDGPRLRMPPRILWASKRIDLEERLRRLDMLRMRFLVVHMGIIANSATETAAAAKHQPPGLDKAMLQQQQRDMEKVMAQQQHYFEMLRQQQLQQEQERKPQQQQQPQPPTTPIPSLARSLVESIKTHPPLRRVATTPIKTEERPTERPKPRAPDDQRAGWMGVVQELQQSPRMHKRHETIENALAMARGQVPDSPPDSA